MSVAWRATSPNTRRLMDRLLVEHCQHGGFENGNLIVTYDQFKDYGLSKHHIAEAIREAVFLGLITYTHGGRYAGSNHPNKYFLTWMGGRDQDGDLLNPTNPWKSVTAEQIAAQRFERKRQRAHKRNKVTKKQNAPPNEGASSPPKKGVS